MRESRRPAWHRPPDVCRRATSTLSCSTTLISLCELLFLVSCRGGRSAELKRALIPLIKGLLHDSHCSAPTADKLDSRVDSVAYKRLSPRARRKKVDVDGGSCRRSWTEQIGPVKTSAASYTANSVQPLFERCWTISQPSSSASSSAVLEPRGMKHIASTSCVLKDCRLRPTRSIFSTCVKSPLLPSSCPSDLPRQYTYRQGSPPLSGWHTGASTTASSTGLMSRVFFCMSTLMMQSRPGYFLGSYHRCSPGVEGLQTLWQTALKTTRRDSGRSETTPPNALMNTPPVGTLNGSPARSRGTNNNLPSPEVWAKSRGAW
eukprot:Hpha_TRINITY_DN16237_c1_g12::TRINITY_DN16237_c1_g12_i1::g.16609::m.16609